MLTITPQPDCQTVMVTYDVPHGHHGELVDLLRKVFRDFVSAQPGFVGSAIHVNDAKTRIATYSQWKSRDDFLAVLRTEEMQEVSRKLGEMSNGFAPVLYDVDEVFSPG